MQNTEQTKLISNIFASNKGCGFRLKAKNKKYGLYVCRGKKGNAAIVTQRALDEFCLKANITKITSNDYIFEYTAKMFVECHRLKNINVHRCKKVPANIKYKDQLKTKEWEDYRKVVFSNKGKICEMCGAKKKLQIHHKKYIFGRKAWEYPLSEIMVLCEDCHKKVHNIA